MQIKFKFKLRRLVFLPALFFVITQMGAQESYFQQEVNYRIEVRLNDKVHSLSAHENIQYTNNSHQTLDVIWMHLWPNAYKNKNTALCKQMLDQKNATLYFAKEEEKGFIDSLDFEVNGRKVKWEFDNVHIDICKLILNEPLLPNQSIQITTPFYVKLPDAKFSRMGHTGQSYGISQWYPKPAVFDREGWHPMPYLDQGEFYSEFGSFDVSISLPANYRLAATGDRMNAADEEAFLAEIEKVTRDHLEKKDTLKQSGFPVSDSVYKTVRFRQNRVHDFAWFADKRFYVLHDEVALPTSGRTVSTWVMYTPGNAKFWDKAINYVNDAVLFYSKNIGDYPYNHVTAIDGTIMAGGGMEYPNITVISQVGDDVTLDITITHEVGHNWFYGILGSNERDHAFMDEGLNSYYERRYTKNKYFHKSMAEWIGRDSTFHWMGLNKFPYWKEMELSYFIAMKNRSDQAIDLPSTAFTAYNYGAVVYSKTALVFDYLMDYLGEEKFDKAMQYYYNQYRFKHPQPEDLYRCFYESSGMNMEAFEHYFIKTNSRFDYKIKSLKRTESGSYILKVKNKTGSPVPFATYAYKHNKPVGLVWSNGFEGQQHIEFPPLDADYFVIDGEHKLPDQQRSNNTMRVKGLFKKIEPLQIRFVTGLEEENKTQLGFLPIAGANFYNGFMIGTALHNFSLYKKKFEFYIAPMYAFQTKNITGFGEFTYHFFPLRTFRQISTGLRLKSFAYDYFDSRPYNQTNGTSLNPLYCNYYRLNPFVEFEFKKKQANSKINQVIDLSSTILYTDSLFYGTDILQGPEKKLQHSNVNRVDYQLNNRRLLHPNGLEVSLWQSGTMVKSALTFVQKFTISNHSVAEMRVFAGAFVSGDLNTRSYYAFRASGYNGYQDKLFDQNFIARNETNGLGFSQFGEEDGAMKIWTPLGQSSTWQIALNFKSPNLLEIPKVLRLPLKLYADLVFTDKQFLNQQPLLWDIGLNISLFNSIIDVYIPFWFSKDIRDALDLNQVTGAQRIRFTLNIHKFAPGKLLSNVIQ